MALPAVPEGRAGLRRISPSRPRRRRDSSPRDIHAATVPIDSATVADAAMADACVAMAPTCDRAARVRSRWFRSCTRFFASILTAFSLRPRFASSWISLMSCFSRRSMSRNSRSRSRWLERTSFFTALAASLAVGGFLNGFEKLDMAPSCASPRDGFGRLSGPPRGAAHKQMEGVSGVRVDGFGRLFGSPTRRGAQTNGSRSRATRVGAAAGQPARAVCAALSTVRAPHRLSRALRAGVAPHRSSD